MADASVSKSDICEYVGVQVPPRPPQRLRKKAFRGFFYYIQLNFSQFSEPIQRDIG